MAGKLDGGLNGSPLHDVLRRVKDDYNTVGERVYGVLRQCIETDDFAPGEWLRQQTLAEAFGVSRIPVRTALLQLEAEGLVSFTPPGRTGPGDVGETGRRDISAPGATRAMGLGAFDGKDGRTAASTSLGACERTRPSRARRRFHRPQN